MTVKSSMGISSTRNRPNRSRSWLPRSRSWSFWGRRRRHPPSVATPCITLARSPIAACSSCRRRSPTSGSSRSISPRTKRAHASPIMAWRTASSSISYRAPPRRRAPNRPSSRGCSSTFCIAERIARGGASSTREDDEQQERDDIGDLDRRVDSRTGGVLVGVADGVPGHRRLVRLAALEVFGAVLVDKTVLKTLLCIVPGAAAGRHRNRHEKPVDDDAEERRAQCREGRRLRAGNQKSAKINGEWRKHRQKRRHDHFPDRRLGQHVERAAVIGTFRPLHNAGLFAELAPYFLDNGARRAADRGHRDAAEEVGNHAAKNQPCHDIGVRYVEGYRAHSLEIGKLIWVRGEKAEIMAIGIKSPQGAEPSRADRIALGHRLRRIADRVERVGHVPDLLRQARHLSNAAGIVGHRTESIERDNHPGEAHHGGHRDRSAEETGEVTSRDNAADDDQRRQRG